MRLVALLCFFFPVLWAQDTLSLKNGAMEVTVLSKGASITSIVLNADASRTNPLWTTSREGSGKGHFLCLDGFGPVSPDESAAGLKFHGEAVLQEFAPKLTETSGLTELTLDAQLPLVRERLTRTMRLAGKENIIYVHSRLESLLNFDRPVVWAEHATIGSPFLQRGVTAVDLSAERSKTRAYAKTNPNMPYRLKQDTEFTWPNAPSATAGQMIDLRAAPPQGSSTGHTTHLMMRSSPYSWVTAVNPESKLLIGWLFRTADFPWLQTWESYPSEGMLARGLEFSTQPWDMPRRDVVALNKLFDAQTFRWLPAKSVIETDFAIFVTKTPDGWKGTKNLVVKGKEIVLESTDGQKLQLPASLIF